MRGEGQSVRVGPLPYDPKGYELYVQTRTMKAVVAVLCL